MSKIFFSKIDKWILVVYFGLMLTCILISCLLLVTLPNLFGAIILSFFLLCIGIVFPAWTLLATTYQVGGGVLKIRSGPLKWEITLESIKSITPTRDIESAPAFSRDRLRIDYEQYKSIMISPEDKSGFLSELQSNKTT